MTEAPASIKVVIADDDADRVARWGERIRDVFASRGVSGTAMELKPSDFGLARRALIQRAVDARAGQAPQLEDAAAEIDSADIFIVDSDLTPTPGSASGDQREQEIVTRYLAGEIGSDVVRLARGHSRVRACVVVNEEWRNRTFDLTMRKWTTGFADLYITHDDIASSGLWFGELEGGYRPSHWPRLGHVPAQVGAVLGQALNLDTPVTELIGMSPKSLNQLSLRQIEALNPRLPSLSEMTLADVENSPNFGIGIQPKESPASEQIALTTAVYGLRRWLDRVALPVQNVLIDLPHLLANRPWLQNERANPVALNAATGVWFGEEVPIEQQAFNADASRLLGRNVWNVDQLSKPGPGDRVTPDDLVFCEDTSSFERLEDAKGFRTDLEGNYATRYVRKIDDVEYSPRHRLFER
ncbi:MAG: hypothetical protein WBL06_07255 [Pseudolysinimonas sp.]|uniref:hypothetical protein n=1 Tax=Pseudolysinimonas sp. TaxID=2680009 RepID=UPI003C792E58